MKFRGTIASDMTGKLGGVVASHNRYGTYFRRLVKPVNRRTPAQHSQRSSFSTITQSWRTLSADVIAAWNAAGPNFTVVSKNGSRNTLSGQALYMRLNTIRERCGVAPIGLPPTSDTAAALTTPTIAVGVDGSVSIDFNASDPWNHAGGCFLVSVTTPQGPGRTFNNTFTDVIQAAAPLSSPASATLGFAVTPGQSLKFRIGVSDPTGRLSEKVYVTATVPLAPIATAARSTASPLLLVAFDGPVNASSVQLTSFNLTQSSTTTEATAGSQGSTPNELVLTFGDVIPAPGGSLAVTAFSTLYGASTVIVV